MFVFCVFSDIDADGLPSVLTDCRLQACNKNIINQAIVEKNIIFDPLEDDDCLLINEVLFLLQFTFKKTQNHCCRIKCFQCDWLLD